MIIRNSFKGRRKVLEHWEGCDPDKGPYFIFEPHGVPWHYSNVFGVRRMGSRGSQRVNAVLNAAV